MNFGVHFTVTKESRISDRVIELLNASVGSSSFAQFQAPIFIPGLPQQVSRAVNAFGALPHTPLRREILCRSPCKRWKFILRRESCS